MAPVPEALPADLFPELSDRQRATIPLVLAGPTVAAGLSAAELPRSTWYRWCQDLPVQQVISHFQRQAMRESLGDLQAGMRFAVSALLGLMTSANEQIKLQACRDILTFGLRGAELLDLTQRMDALEVALQPLIEQAHL